MAHGGEDAHKAEDGQAGKNAAENRAEGDVNQLLFEVFFFDKEEADVDKPEGPALEAKSCQRLFKQEKNKIYTNDIKLFFTKA